MYQADSSDFRQRYEKKRWVGHVLTVLGILQAIFLVWSMWSWLSVATLVVYILACVIFTPVLRCPSCQKDLESKPIKFCPSCGSMELVKPYFWGMSSEYSCRACGVKFIKLRGGHREYVIRNCTHCGAQVDAEGI